MRKSEKPLFASAISLLICGVLAGVVVAAAAFPLVALSGLAAKAGITCLNTPGTIDSDYRGEVKVILINLGAEDFTIRRGDRIAQMVVAPVAQAAWAEVEDLDETARGAGGFGSTGHG